MAKRYVIVPGYTGAMPEQAVESFLRHLIGQFEDELSEADKLLLEYTSVAALPDLAMAEYDTETFTLSSLPEGSSAPPRISVSVGHEPRDGVKSLLPAFYTLVYMEWN